MIFAMLEINLKLKVKIRNKNFIVKHYLVKSSKVWKVIDKIPKPNGKRIRINPNELNKHFSTTSKRLTGRSNADLHVLKYIINNMSPSSVNKLSFKLRSASYKELSKKLKVYAKTALLVMTIYL